MNKISDLNHVHICHRFNLLTSFLCKLSPTADSQVLSQVEGRVIAESTSFTFTETLCWHPCGHVGMSHRQNQHLNIRVLEIHVILRHI